MSDRIVVEAAAGGEAIPVTLPSGNKRGGRGTRNHTASRFTSWWFVIPAIVLVLVIHYVAVLIGAGQAFTDSKGVGSASFVGLQNFAQAFESTKARKALFNTLFLAVIFLILTNVFGLLLALALNRTLRTRYFLRVLLFMPVVLSPLAVSYVWKFIFQQTGPLNTALKAIGLDSWVTTWLGNPKTAIWTILVVMVWQSLGLAMVVYLAGLANIPSEIEEAASVDGAGIWTRFFAVTLPLLRPTVVVVSTLLLIRGLGVFDQVLGMTAGGPFGATETMATIVYRETYVNGNYGYGAALSLLLTAIILVASVLQMALLRGRED